MPHEGSHFSQNPHEHEEHKRPPVFDLDAHARPPAIKPNELSEQSHGPLPVIEFAPEDIDVPENQKDKPLTEDRMRALEESAGWKGLSPMEKFKKLRQLSGRQQEEDKFAPVPAPFPRLTRQGLAVIANRWNNLADPEKRAAYLENEKIQLGVNITEEQIRDFLMEQEKENPNKDAAAQGIVHL